MKKKRLKARRPNAGEGRKVERPTEEKETRKRTWRNHVHFARRWRRKRRRRRKIEGARGRADESGREEMSLVGDSQSVVVGCSTKGR